MNQSWRSNVTDLVEFGSIVVLIAMAAVLMLIILIQWMRSA
jgi:hypothetical protein